MLDPDTISKLTLERIIEELIRLKKGVPKLPTQDGYIAELLFAELKAKNYTPTKVEKATGGVWKVPTTKYYWPSGPVKGSTTPTIPLEQMPEMISRNLTLDQVEMARDINQRLKTSGVSLEKASELIALADHSGMPVARLVSAHTEIIKSEIPVDELADLLAYRKTLQTRGISVEKVGKLVNLVNMIGAYDDTISAVTSLGSLNRVRADIDAASQQKLAIEFETKQLDAKLAAERQQLQLIQKSLDLYQELEQRGFDLANLEKLATIRRKFGGPVQVLEALNAFDGLTALLQHIDKTRLQSEAASGKLEKLKADHIHLSHAIEMCNKLLSLGFNLYAIEKIYDTAKFYGEPLEVLNAISQHGQIPRLLNEREESLKEVSSLKTQLADFEETKRKLQELTAIDDSTSQRALILLEEILDEMPKPAEQRRYRNDIDQAVVDKIQQIIDSEVSKRIEISSNEALAAPFRQEAIKQTNSLLKFWDKNLLGPQTKERIAKLKDACYANPFIVFKGEWHKYCSICEYDHALKLVDIYDIRQFLRVGYSEVKPEPIHEALKGQHKIRITLEDVVKLYVGRAAKTGSDTSLHG